MQTWWNDSPYYVYFPYIGGSNRSNCGGATVDWNWMDLVLNQGWTVVPLWVGPQIPKATCGGAGYSSSIVLNNDAGAYNQGAQEAGYAMNQLASDGIAASTHPPFAYDLEAYSYGISECQRAAEYFIEGWDHTLNNYSSGSVTDGVYGSSCGSDLMAFAGISDVPHFIYGASWDGIESTSTMACIGSGDWAQQNRHKQYQSGHNATWGTLTMNIDSDCANAFVTGIATGVGSGPCS